MDIIGIYLFDQNMGTAFVKARCTHIPLVLIFLGEMQLSVVKLRSALSPLASCLSYHFLVLFDSHYKSRSIKEKCCLLCSPFRRL